MVRTQRRRALRNALDDLDRYAGTFELDRLTADRDAQRLVLHALYVAIQACVDEAAEICRAAGLDCGQTYRDVFVALGGAGLVEPSLAGRMTRWASLRNVLAHFYPVLEMQRVHEALDQRQDLRDFECPGVRPRHMTLRAVHRGPAGRRGAAGDTGSGFLKSPMQGVSWVFMERVARKSHGLEQADRWDVEQHTSMTPEERQRVARELRERAYGTDAPDVRESTRDRE